MMNRFSGSVTRYVRSRYSLAVLGMTMLLIGGMAPPATADEPQARSVRAVDDCTLVSATKPFANTIYNNIANFAKEYGWWMAAIFLILALLLTMGASKKNSKMLGLAAVVFVGMSVLFGAGGLAGGIKNSGGSDC